MKPAKAAFTLVEIMIVVMIVGLLAAIAAPFYAKFRASAQKTGCINNLRQIELAKDQWAIETGRSNRDPLDEAEVNAYIKNRRPTCPANGTYDYKPIGTPPVCSLEIPFGHKL